MTPLKIIVSTVLCVLVVQTATIFGINEIYKKVNPYVAVEQNQSLSELGK